jgi:hydrogenase maturation protease
MVSPIFLIGIGTEYRCDDSLGLHVVRALKKREIQDTCIVESSGDGSELIEMFKLTRIAIVVDAVSAGGKPGTIYRFNVHEQPLLAQLSFHSTHAFGLAEAIELARVLNQLPDTLIVFAIEGENFSTGIGLSASVEKGSRELREMVFREVQKALEQMQTNVN